MLIKLYRADKCHEFFTTDNYLIAPINEMNPIIVKIEVFNDGKRLYRWKRPHMKEYIKNYVPKKQELKPKQS